MPHTTRTVAETSKLGSALTRLWRRRWFVPALLVTAALLVYSNSFKGVFVYDEYLFLVDNESAKHLRFWDYELGISRPLGFFTFALNYLAGDQLWGYHAVNLAIHVAAGCLLYGLVRDTLSCPRLERRYAADARALATIVALIWLIHPLQTQSVTYIYQRLESLMTLFYLATLYAFVRGTRSPQPLAWYALSVICSALGMATKEVMVTAPLAVLWYDRVFVAADWKELFRRRWFYYFLLAGTWLVLGLVMFMNSARYGRDGVLDVSGISPLGYGLNQPPAILHYLRLAFFPYGLCLEYREKLSHDPWQLGPPLVVLLVMLASTLWAMVRWPALGLAAGMFFLVLAPTSSIAPLRDLVYEHRMYLPLASVILLTVLTAHAIWRQNTIASTGAERRRATIVAMLVLAGVVTALSVGTYVRNEAYRSTLVFWQDNVEKRPENSSARYNYAKYLLDADRLQEAVIQLDESIRLYPEFARAYMNRGHAMTKRRRFEEALRNYNEANQLLYDKPVSERDLDYKKDLSTSHCDRGTCYLELGRMPQAISDFNEAIKLDPKYSEAYYNRGKAYQLAPQPIRSLEQAINDYTAAIKTRKNEDYVEAYCNRGTCYLELQKYSDALADETKAITLNPEYPQAYINRATCYFLLNDYDRAWADIHRARSLGVEPNPALIRDLQKASGRQQ